MELVLPMNYVELEQEEMMYLDGGGQVVIYASQALVRHGVQLGVVFICGAIGYYIGFQLAGPLAAGTFKKAFTGWACGTIGSLIGNLIGGIIARGNINSSWYKLYSGWSPIGSGAYYVK